MRKPVILLQGLFLWCLGIALGFYFGFGFGMNRPAPVSRAKPPAPAKASAPPAAILTADTYPKIDGSTSAMPLEQLVFYRALGISVELRKLPGGFAENNVLPTLPLDADGSRVMELTRRRWYAQSFTGTHDAYVHLINHRKKTREPDERNTTARYLPPRRQQDADLILVARRPSPDEVKLAKGLNVELDIRPVALDAFVFVNNAQNSVTTLTLDQLRGVYTGTVKNWAMLGGADRPIKAYTRNRNSGSQELMDSLVMQGRKMIQAPDMNLMTMIDMINRVAVEPDALGYSVYYYEHNMAHDARESLLAIDGIPPTAATIAARKYPLTAEVYVVTRKDAAPDSPAVKLRDWLLSPAGQRVVADSGYVPVK